MLNSFLLGWEGLRAITNIKASFKVPLKWYFCLLFYSKILKYMILWFIIFEFGLPTRTYEFFLQLQSWPIQVKKWDIPCCSTSWRHNVGKNFQAIMASEENKRRSGKFSVTGGPVLASCKTPLTWKALSCLYFRKAKSEEHIVGDLFIYTSPTACPF